MKTMLLAGLLVLGVVATGEAQMLYRYVDKDGQVHMTDDPNVLPKAKSGAVDAMAMPKATARPTPTAPAVAAPVVPPPASGMGGDPEARGRDAFLNADWARKKDAAAYRKTVSACKSEAWIEDTRFEMYEPSPGRYEMVGTPKANFAFKRCMQQRGIPLESSSR